jgi:hypothetical protein
VNYFLADSQISLNVAVGLFVKLLIVDSGRYAVVVQIRLIRVRILLSTLCLFVCLFAQRPINTYRSLGPTLGVDAF